MNHFSYHPNYCPNNIFEEPQNIFPNQNPRPQTIEPAPPPVFLTIECPPLGQIEWASKFCMATSYDVVSTFTFIRVKKEVALQGSTIRSIGISPDLTKRHFPNLTKMLSIKNSTILHIWSAVYRLSSPGLMVSMKYPFSLVIWTYKHWAFLSCCSTRFSIPFHKIWSRHSEALKIVGLIAYIMFYKIYGNLEAQWYEMTS